jgi:hypothetical protein
MIVHWFVGFVGDYPNRKRCWFDIFTTPAFRHVCAIGYDPVHKVWIIYEPGVSNTDIRLFHPRDEELNRLITFISIYGKWVKFKPSAHPVPFGRWRHYCVPAIAHLLGIRSSALTPRGLYGDLIKQGAEPAFEG